MPCLAHGWYAGDSLPGKLQLQPIVACLAASACALLDHVLRTEVLQRADCSTCVAKELQAAEVLVGTSSYLGCSARELRQACSALAALVHSELAILNHAVRVFKC
jgi:hypothetical protein